ncbi:hypothetical protein [Chamaesiphon sp. VAR_48_metabat_403]|uniref:hypothetical protein n=1 Tax=Chamaesiphon sp. VAR_48_metabat_403 TaxID=2964700 RepID=UPI00286E4BF9|nr:hypothetical protein [Chamaesiphon sp. VAR_48_metabat_403]
MRIGNYTAQLEPGIEEESGYIAMKMTDGRSPFKLKLTNHSDLKCKVNVRIHDLDQGTWVLMPNGVANLERPVHIAEKFCAYAVGSEGGNAIGLTAGDPNNGLISIKFTPAKLLQPHAPTPPSAPASVGARYSPTQSRADFGAAGVGTEGESKQAFQTVDDFATDEREAVTINLRIVESKSKPRPLSAASNPIPPAL